MTIATDRVDPEQLEQPQRWELARLRGFMLRFGTLSSVFDLLTFAVLWIGFAAAPPLFRSGWFLESVGTEIAVLMVLRTRRPFYQSRPSLLLGLSTVGIGIVTLALLYSPAGALVGLPPLPLGLLLTLLAITALYVAASEAVKDRYYGRRRGVAATARPASPA